MSKFYVATAIPYVNDVPHLGHALEAIQADVMARYHRQQGDQTFFSYGTDEHGGKIADKAASLNVTPEVYVNQICQSFVELTKILDISYDRFVRTTEPQHVKGAAYIWKQLAKYIYKGSYKGLYDQKEEEFLTLEDGEEIKRSDPARFERLKPIEEENYFFKLSAFGPKIKELIDTNELIITPVTRRNEILSLLDSGLDDISISRPKDKLNWAIPVPDDPAQVMYVWVEALMNYITTLGYPDGDNFKAFWPCDVHVIGKDILRFHAAIWPGMLMALGLPLPKVIFVHGFVNVGGRKMSKSEGTGIPPMDIISTYGSEAMRYFFLRHIPSTEDGDFTWEKFERAYNGELGNELGNLVQRVASMINTYQQGVIGTMPEPEHDTGAYHEAMANLQLDRALDSIFGLIRGLNQYIEESKPWVLAKEQDQEHLREVLAYTASSLLQFADLLAPFLPKTGAKIKEVFGSGVVKNYEGAFFPRINKYTV